MIEDPSPGSVLRNVALQRQRRPLVRPVPPAPVVAPITTEAPALVDERAEIPSAAPADRQTEDSGIDPRQAGWQAGFERGREEGYAAGFEEGQAAAEAAVQRVAEERIQEAVSLAVSRAEDAIDNRLQAIAALRQQIARALEDRLRDAEDDMVALAWETATRIIGSAMTDAQGVRSQLQQALDVWRGSVHLSVHLNPDDLAMIESKAADSTAAPRNSHLEIAFVGDPSIAVGGCLLRAAEGGLDARLDHQLELLKATLRSARERRRAAAVASDAEPS